MDLLPADLGRLRELLEAALQGEGPLYRRIAEALRRAVDRGDLHPGTVLPPERSLAGALSVSRSTIVAAYDRLKAEGWLESRQGSGTWVREREHGPRGGVDAVSTAHLLLDGPRLDPTPPGRRPLPPTGDLVDLFVAATPPSDRVMAALGEVGRRDLEPLSGHHGYVPQGMPALRAAVARRLTADGLPTDDDQVLVTTGAHQAISLVARQVLEPGDAVLVESPTFPGALDIFRRFGARAVPVPVDGAGMQAEGLPELVERTQARLLFVTPHFQNPTGTVLSEDRRRIIAELADRRDLTVIEDLVTSDLRIDDVRLPPPIASFSRQAAVHTIGSASKSFWPGLRTGWLRSPAAWSRRMLSTKTVADLGSPVLSQLVTARLLESADEAMAERRRWLAARRETLLTVLAERLPEWQLVPPAGGMSAWATLPEGNAEGLAALARRHGVAIAPGPALSVDGGNRSSLRVVFARPEPQLRAGLDRLVAAWAAYAPEDGGADARWLV